MHAVKKKCNISVKPKPRERGSVEEQNTRLIRIFLKKFKKSGIIQDLRKKEYPVTKGMKNRQKKHLGKRRAQKKQ